MAQIIGQQLADEASQAGNGTTKPAVSFASAGTHAHHIGEPPDPRATAALARRGYRGLKIRSRRVTSKDFSQFDLILAMDNANVQALNRVCPSEHQHKIRLLLDYANELADKEVPDPYYGNEAGFERVLELCEAGVRGLISQLQTTNPG
jgi:protein-tyrosine phosphatase